MTEKDYKKHDLSKIAQSRIINYYDLLWEIQLDLSSNFEKSVIKISPALSEEKTKNYMKK